MFLGGTYQEVMGNLHNLFGSTDAVQIRLADVGDYQVEHVPDLLLERLQVPSEQAISNGPRRIGEAGRRMDHLKSSMRQSTYLQS
jgi:arginine decarboxylase